MFLVSNKNAHCFKKGYPSGGIKETHYKVPISHENINKKLRKKLKQSTAFISSFLKDKVCNLFPKKSVYLVALKLIKE